MKILKELAKAYEQKLPFVVYKKPNEQQVNGFFQKTSDLYYTKDFSEQGFVFAPFQEEFPTVLIPLQSSRYVQENLVLGVHKLPPTTIASEEDPIAKEKHIALVAKGVEAITSGMFEKVVLSRKEAVSIAAINLVEIFEKLLERYSRALVYIWFHPEIGLWLGATPETLIKVSGNHFETMALAGTQTYAGTTEVIWQQKEIEEQQFVTDYIVNKLEKVGASVHTSDIETVQAGSLLHLKTRITGTIAAPEQNDRLAQLVRALHPTPAVCGMPKEVARQFILKHEGYDRNYYTGFLGEVHLKSESDTETHTSLFVNLRCMEIAEDKAQVYVGGGITKASVPEKEWEETMAKAMVMKAVL